VALLVGALTLVPQIAWNISHDWAMAEHTAGRVKHAGIAGVLLNPPAFVFGQAAVASPILFVLMFIALYRHARLWRQDASLFVVCATVPVLLFFGGLSFFHHINENWPVTMYGGMVLAGATWWAPRWSLAAARRWIIAAFALGGVMTAMFVWPDITSLAIDAGNRIARSVGLPPALDAMDQPASRAVGWRAAGLLATKVSAELDPPVFLMTRRADHASLLSFYSPGQPWSVPVPHERVSTQYDIWNLWPAYRGWNAVFVERIRPDMTDTKHDRPGLTQEGIPLFERWDPPRYHDVQRHGQVVARFKLWLCRGFRGWPPTGPAGSADTAKAPL
jgi:hypothetical protein